MLEEKAGWRALLEKEGLHQAAHILEKYGIDSQTDLSQLEQHKLWVRTWAHECLNILKLLRSGP
jgi:hypothetical protein